MIAIYLRVSTEHQETAAQLSKITAWCQQQKYPESRVRKYSDDGISGKTITARPGFQKLLADIESGLVKRVVTFEASRLSRDMVDLMNIMDTFQRHGVILEIPGKGQQRFETAMDRFMMSMQGFVAQQFLEDHSRRVRAGIAAAKQRDPDYRHGMRPGTKAPRKSPTQSAENIDKVKTYHNQKLTTREIAKLTGLSQSSVSRIIRQHLA